MYNSSADFSQDPSTSMLPLGTKVFWRFSGNLIIAETLLGAIALILIAASEVPNPLLQGWVIFVATLFCICSLVQFILYVTRVPDNISDDWMLKDLVYYILAFSCYLSASVLQAYFCIDLSYRVTTGHIYGFNVAAVVFAFVVTLLYGMSLSISLNLSKV
uniref:myelin and lymphocyte protein-like n=1 Tax=Myxine glutinosa TaxID=7769 RepID=UPI00358E259F